MSSRKRLLKAPLLGACFCIIVLLFFSGTSFATATSVANGIYGWSVSADSTGKIDFVSINKTTGLATFLFKLPIPSGYQAASLTYDPTNGHFYGNLVGPSDYSFADIDPVLQTMTTYSYTGSLVGEVFFDGLEKLKGFGLVVSSGTTNATTKLSKVSPTGVGSGTMQMPTIVDQDVLVANSCGGPLYAFDANHHTNNNTINEWTDPFGVPSLTGVYSGLDDPTNDGDVAIDPPTNKFYVSRGTSLWNYNLSPTNTAVKVGDFNYPDAIGGIVGIAAVGSCTAIPTLSEWGLIIFSLLLMTTIVWYLRKRKLQVRA